MKVLTVVGARPQFIKAAPVTAALKSAGHEEVLVHTGQHYANNMSAVFFEELEIAPPRYNLEVGSDTHGKQTGRMIIALEQVMEQEKPDWVLIYGDTNSTLAGALAASKLHLRIAHIEAGLRSFNRAMPEEINRVVADHLADLLLCPSETAVNNLAGEGIQNGVHLVGDVMYEALRQGEERACQRSHILRELDLEPGRYALATLHRAENTGDPDRLRSILDALELLDEVVIFPVHPGTRKKITAMGWSSWRPPSVRLRMIEPAGYLDMIMLERSARLILTDSGGIQKEAYWLSVPCVTMREETEWVETVESGWNTLGGTDTERILSAARSARRPDAHPDLYQGEGAAARCVQLLDQASPDEHRH